MSFNMPISPTLPVQFHSLSSEDRHLTLEVVVKQCPDLYLGALDEYLSSSKRSKAAVQAGDKLDLFLRHAASPNAAASDGLPGLSKSIQQKRPWLFKRLLKEYYIEVNHAAYPQGPTAMSMAILNGNQVAFQRLLSAGAMVSAKTLEWSAGCGRLGMLQTLADLLENAGTPMLPMN